MKIEKICINGVGGIKHLELNFNKGMNIICGTNGIGKTTILECISHLFIQTSTSQLKRNISSEKGSVEAELEIYGQNRSYSYEIKDFEPDKQDFVSTIEIERSRDIIVFNPIRSFDYIKLESISRDPERDDYKTMNIAYQGVSAEDIKNWFVQRYMWSAHKNSLNKEQIHNLQCSKEAFSILDKEVTFSNIKPDTFDILLNTKQGEIFFEYLSSGYKSCVYILLGIIKEIEYRYKDPYIKVQDFNGIILIDEIDVHLHPQWQARLVNALKELLPNAQIIATTHSPSIIQTAETNEIIALYFDDNNDICIKELEQKEYGYQGWTIEEILRDVMGMEETMSSFYEDTSKKFERAINEENIKTAKECYKILNKMLHPQNYLRKILEIQMIGMGMKMIKINRTEKPSELTDEIQQKLTDEFKKDSKKTVWNKPYIRNALFKMSNGKCCYCEVKLAEEGKDIHVEHFHPKSKYPDEVVSWENLLPACKRCNVSKSTHDTYEEEIINPSIDNPKDYLYMANYWYKCKNTNEKDRKKAKDTIDVLSLNDMMELVNPRFQIGNEIEEKIEQLLDKMEEYKDAPKKKIQQKNKIVNGIRDLLRMAQKTEEYSATVATVIMGDEDYKTLKAMMKECDLWNDELTNLDKVAEEINLNLK